MKRTMMLVAVAFVAMIVIGCTTPVDPPTSVKVYLTGAESFTRVDAAGSLAMSDIYQWDNDADGTVDDDTMYTGDDVVVEFDATHDTEWTITVGGNVYLNNANIGPTFVHQPVMASLDFAFGVVDGVIRNTNVDMGDGVVGPTFTEMALTYTGSNTITTEIAGGHTWTR